VRNSPGRGVHEGGQSQRGPDNLVQVVKAVSIETTQELMKAVDVVVATGGGAMVKSAYSSGKPSFGVGAGNVPVIIDREVDFKDAVEKIVRWCFFRTTASSARMTICVRSGRAISGNCETSFWLPGRFGSPKMRTRLKKFGKSCFQTVS